MGPDFAKQTRRVVLRWTALLTLAVVAALLLVQGIGAFRQWRADLAAVETYQQQSALALGPDRPPTPENFAPLQVVARQPVVEGYAIVDIERADQLYQDDEFVLGVEVNGEARAYPINVMTGPQREVFNDELGGAAIAATW